MLLKFATNEVESYSGARTFINDGQPLEVDAATGEDMLRATAKIRQKGKKLAFDTVNIFEVYKETPKESPLPEGFPHRDDLEKNRIYTFEQLFALDHGKVLALKFIGEKKADEILAARDGYNEDGTPKDVAVTNDVPPGDATNAETGEETKGGEALPEIK
jgi:hypothetical protein